MFIACAADCVFGGIEFFLLEIELLTKKDLLTIFLGLLDLFQMCLFVSLRGLLEVGGIDQSKDACQHRLVRRVGDHVGCRFGGIHDDVLHLAGIDGFKVEGVFVDIELEGILDHVFIDADHLVEVEAFLFFFVDFVKALVGEDIDVLVGQLFGDDGRAGSFLDDVID